MGGTEKKWKVKIKKKREIEVFVSFRCIFSFRVWFIVIDRKWDFDSFNSLGNSIFKSKFFHSCLVVESAIFNRV